MVTEFLQLISKLIEIFDQLKNSSQSDRQLVADHLHKVGDCLVEIADAARKGEPHSVKWGELKEYAESLPQSTRKAIGLSKEQDISRLLNQIMTSAPLTSEDAEAIATAGGRLHAIANKILTDKDNPKKSGIDEKLPAVRKPIYRRSVLLAALVPATTAATVIGFGGYLRKQQELRWKMVSFLDDSVQDKVLLYEVPKRVSEKIKIMTQGNFNISIVTGIRNTDTILDMVNSKECECGFSGIYYEKDDFLPLYFGCAVPFGLSPHEQTAWLTYKKQEGDLTYIQALYRKLGLNVIPFPAGATGTQMGGWFRNEIISLDQLKDITIRIPGLGARVWERLGASTATFKPNEIARELRKNSINAAEWIGPYDDYRLGLSEAGASYYYHPGWWEPSTTFDIQVNQDAWNKLSDFYKYIFKSACMETYLSVLSEYDRLNSQYLETLVNARDKIRPFPKFLVKEAKLKTDELLSGYDKTIKHFKEVHQDWDFFKDRIRGWSSLS
jgi:TRAP-type mannitol/chloroaromatic compound transport system substrate-binding protein